MRRVSITGLLIGVLLVCGLLFAAAEHHSSSHHVVEDEDEGYLSAIRHKISNLWPWGDKLGDDWSDTQDRVEDIYRRTHNEAKTRVEELKEETIREADLQKKIADIYQDSALKAEKEIEALKHPLMEKLTSWVKFHGREPTHEEKRTLLERLGWTSKKVQVPSASEFLPHHIYEDTTTKIRDTYRSALDQAKAKLSDVNAKVGDLGDKISGKVGEAGSTATQGWEATKAKAAHAYNEAFHKGHFETRSRFGQLSDMMGRGLRGVGRFTKSAAYKTVELVWFLLTSVGLLAIGGFLTMGAMRFWNKQQLRKQLHANVAGPVMACGEYYVVGGENEQKKFYDFWSNTGYGYFSRQPGLRKYWMHRGVPGAENNWMSYSEWATIDDLRRACSSTEFCEIKKRSPGYPLKQMHIYQLASTGQSGAGASRVEGEGSSSNKDGSTLRQRTTTTTAST